MVAHRRFSITLSKICAQNVFIAETAIMVLLYTAYISSLLERDAMMYTASLRALRRYRYNYDVTGAQITNEAPINIALVLDSLPQIFTEV